MQTSAVAVAKPVAETIQLIPVDKIDPSPFNARKDFPKEYLAELGASIARDGQQQAGKVRPMPNGRFQLVYGECRWRGAKLTGVELYKAVVEAMDDAKAEQLCLIENLKRQDLTPFEEADKIQRMHEVYKVKVDDLATQVGKSVRSIFEALKLASIGKEVRTLMVDRGISLSNTKLISRLKKDDQINVSKSHVAQWSHDQLEQHIRENYMVDLRQAPFATNLKGFPCLAATCDECPRNAKNAKDEFPELKGAAVCVSPDNYKKKVDLFAKSVVADAKKSGQEVLDEKEAEATFRGDGKYLPLTKEVWVGNERKTLQSLIPKKVELKTAIALDDEGAPVQVASRADVQAALKKAGKKAAANSHAVTGTYSSGASYKGDSTYKNQQKQRRTKLGARREVAALAIDALADHQHTTAGDDVFLKLLGLGLVEGRIDDDGLQKMLKRLGNEKKTDYGPSAVGKLLEAAKGVELRKLMVRTAMAGGYTAGGTWSDSHAGQLLGALKLYGLKLERFQSEAKKAKEAKATKPAPKKDPLDSPAVAKAKAAKSKKKAA